MMPGPILDWNALTKGIYSKCWVGTGKRDVHVDQLFISCKFCLV